SISTRKILLQHCPCPLTHLDDTLGIRGEINDSLSEALHVAWFNHNATFIMINKLRDFSLFGANGDDWSSCSSYSVEFAWKDQSLKLRLERNPVHIDKRERVLQRALFLIRKQSKNAIQARLFDLESESIKSVSPTNADKYNSRLLSQLLCCANDGVD